MKPRYLELVKNGKLAKKKERLYKILESCELCPRKCYVNRLEGELGICKSGKELIVSSYGPHFGEEEPLVGRGGSGTIFLTNCNLGCCYCQNYEISHLGQGQEVPIEEVAKMMITLQESGCNNINLVTPTHFAPQLVAAIEIGSEKGLELPIVWNCSGYENVEVIKLLDGVVDIYMPDIKYGEKEPAKKYSHAPDYFERCQEAVKEMHRQVGDLKLDQRGITYRGLLIRHLVLPNELAGSEQVLKFIAEEISKDSYVNIMSQYRPYGRAYLYPELNRGITKNEFQSVIEMAKKFRLTRAVIQNIPLKF